MTVELRRELELVFDAAVKAHQAGRLGEAEGGYVGILRRDERFAKAMHLLGVLRGQQGRREEGIELIRKAIALEPGQGAFWANLAVLLKGAGRMEEAVEAYRGALNLWPTQAGLWQDVGDVGMAIGRVEGAVGCYQNSLRLNPANAAAANNLGVALAALGRGKEAIRWFSQAAVLRPEFADAIYNLGCALKDAYRLEEAVGSFREAIRIVPGHAGAVMNLGSCLHMQGKVGEAVETFRRAVELRPELAEGHGNLGAALCAMGKVDEAKGACLRAIGLNPELAEAYNTLGYAHKESGELEEALACYRKALAIRPGYAAAHSNVMNTLHFVPGVTGEEILAEGRRWREAQVGVAGKDVGTFENDRGMADTGRKLRIGYVSPDFREHCQALFMVPLLRHHDRERFEIFCYSDVVAADAQTERIKGLSDGWREIAGVSDEAVAEQIRADRIDVLVDLTMHMAGNRLKVFARRAAPVQVTWLAYPGTTGLAAETGMDFRLSDGHLDPPALAGERTGRYAEETVLLRDTFWCYDAQAAGVEVSALPARKNGFVTFGCLNNFCKVNEGVLRMWGRVMARVKQSRLILLSPEGEHRERALQVLRGEGIEFGRVTFEAFLPRVEYLKLYDRIDIGLDTVPYNGHTTSLDAMWMGVPVVTLVGKTVVGRAGVSQLMNVGMPELIAHSEEEFVEIAAGLAGDVGRLEGIRAGLRGRMEKSPLMDAGRFARSMEAAFLEMWGKRRVKRGG